MGGLLKKYNCWSNAIGDQSDFRETQYHKNIISIRMSVFRPKIVRSHVLLRESSDVILLSPRRRIVTCIAVMGGGNGVANGRTVTHISVTPLSRRVMQYYNDSGKQL